MTPLVVLFRRRESPATLSGSGQTDHACRKARFEAARFYRRNGGLGQRILYRIFSWATIFP